jgi:hypothetical protein
LRYLKSARPEIKANEVNKVNQEKKQNRKEYNEDKITRMLKMGRIKQFLLTEGLVMISMPTEVLFLCPPDIP